MLKLVIGLVLIVFSFFARAADVEVFIGAQNTRIQEQADENIPRGEAISNTGYIAGVNVIRPISYDGVVAERHYFGMGVDIVDTNSGTLIGLRPVNYYYQLHPRIRVGAFFGAATLDNTLPSIGYYLGVTATSKNLLGPLDVHLGITHGNGLGRDKKAALNEIDDPDLTTRPDFFLNTVTGFIAVQYGF